MVVEKGRSKQWFKAPTTHHRLAAVVGGPLDDDLRHRLGHRRLLRSLHPRQAERQRPRVGVHPCGRREAVGVSHSVIPMPGPPLRRWGRGPLGDTQNVSYISTLASGGNQPATRRPQIQQPLLLGLKAGGWLNTLRKSPCGEAIYKSSAWCLSIRPAFKPLIVN